MLQNFIWTAIKNLIDLIEKWRPHDYGLLSKPRFLLTNPVSFSAQEPSYSSKPSYSSSEYKSSSGYKTPKPSYDAPAPSYDSPSSSYEKPSYDEQDDYGAPKAPLTSYGTETANNYGYKRLASQRY